MTAGFDQSARVALAAIVADAGLRPAALSDPGTLANLLADYLPGAPREAGLLMAAARAKVASTLRDHVAHGMDPATAIRITAASLAAATAYSSDACLWVSGELAIPLGATTADRLPQLAPPGEGTDLAGAARSVPDARDTIAPSAPPARLIHGTSAGRRRRGRIWIVLPAAAGAAALAAAGAVLILHKTPPRAAGQPAPAARHLSATVTGRQRQRASGQWTASKLVITPHSLGAVTVGMTLAQASAAAGVQIVEVGDGFGYPSGNSSTGLAIAGPPQDPVHCVIADAASAGPNVVTPEGFLLGGTTQALKSLYGTRLRFVPAPATGYNPEPGYVVSFPDGNLAFIARNGLVTAIIGGKNAMPSTR